MGAWGRCTRVRDCRGVIVVCGMVKWYQIVSKVGCLCSRRVCWLCVTATVSETYWCRSVCMWAGVAGECGPGGVVVVQLCSCEVDVCVDAGAGWCGCMAGVPHVMCVSAQCMRTWCRRGGCGHVCDAFGCVVVRSCGC